MKRAVVYLRVSSEKQATEDRTSLALQESECRQYAEREGWEVIGVHYDTITGFNTLDTRPGFQEVKAILGAQGADIVLTWMIDRMFRDQTDMLVFVRDSLMPANAQIVSVMEGAFESTGTGKLILGILAWKAEQERLTIRDRLHGNMRAQVKQGRIKPGPTPAYGYKWVGENKEGYAINEEVAPVVRFIYQSIDAGVSLHGVAKALNERGVLTPSRYLDSQGMWPEAKKARLSGNWRRQSITYLIANPAYCGRYAAYRYTTVKNKNGKYVPRELDASDERRVELPGLVPAIVSVEQWERVQAAVRDRTLSPAPGPDEQDKPLLLNGIGICGVCGGRVTSLKHHSSGEKGYICTQRANRVGPLQTPCPGGSWMLRVADLDGLVWEQVQEMARDTEAFQAMLAAPMRAARDKLDAANRREGAIQAELAAARKELETVSRRMTAEQDDELAAVYGARYKELKRQISGLETRQKETGKTEDKLQAYLDGIAKAAGMLGSGPLNFAEFSADMARSVARASGLSESETEAHMEKLMDDGTFARAAYHSGILEPTREQKRTLLRAIGAQVLMYPVKHEYTQTHSGQRWELQVGVPCDDNGGRYRRIVNGGK